MISAMSGTILKHIPSASKSNQLWQVVISRLFFIDSRYILHIPLRWWVTFPKSWWTSTNYFSNSTGSYVTKGHFTHETESPWPLHFKHSHWWKRRSWSRFDSHYTRGTNILCECKMDVKSTWIPTWHRTDHISWSLGLVSKTTSWR